MRESLFAVVFVVLLAFFLYAKRSRLSIQKVLFPFIYVVMYRGRFGLRFMDSFAKKLPRSVRFLSIIGVLAGFAGMVFIAFTLFQNAYRNIFSPAAVPGVALVLPVQVKGAFFVPFFYWIISIFVLAVVHEFAHGVVARLNRVKIKSSGMAFIGLLLPILPAAFVEPDERQVARKRKIHQMAVFAAGPFTNVLLGVIVLLIFIAATPAAVNSFYEPAGVFVNKLDAGYPAAKAGIQPGDVIVSVDRMQVTYLSNFTSALQDKKPGDRVTVQTKNASYSILLAANPVGGSRGYLGVYAAEQKEIKPRFLKNPVVPVIFWLLGLMYWLYVMNIGVGLFNLVPIGPLDGGRMFRIAAKGIFRYKGEKVANFVSVMFILLVVFNLAFSFLR